MELILVLLLGALAGTVTGLLPGLHVNTLAALLFAVAPDAGPAGAVFLLAVGTVHTIVNILPATYLGVPDADDVVAVLPAHRLLLAGRGPEAVSVSVAASLAGAMAALALGVGLKAFLQTAVARWVDMLTPILLAVALILLWAQEAPKGREFSLRAMAVSLLAGGLGWLSLHLPLAPFVQVPPSPLLPLLGGLFGAAGLTVALQRPPVLPPQHTAAHVPRRPMAALTGALLASGTALLPGLTAAVAVAMVPGIRGRPLHAVAAMSAINTAHAVLAVVVWLVTGRVRSGLAASMDQWLPVHWLGEVPGREVLLLGALVVLAAALGALATLGLDRVLRGHVERLPARGLAIGGLVAITALVAALSGAVGLLLYATAILVGRLPLRMGVRRVHLVACLIIPVLMRT